MKFRIRSTVKVKNECTRNEPKRSSNAKLHVSRILTFLSFVASANTRGYGNSFEFTDLTEEYRNKTHVRNSKTISKHNEFTTFFLHDLQSRCSKENNEWKKKIRLKTSIPLETLHDRIASSDSINKAIPLKISLIRYTGVTRTFSRVREPRFRVVRA